MRSPGEIIFVVLLPRQRYAFAIGRLANAPWTGRANDYIIQDVETSETGAASHDDSAATPHRVVIVGAGFGGLEAAFGLAGAPVRITLIDRRNHHLFQPLLYQVATASLATSEIAWPIRHLLRDRPEVTTLFATVTGVDADRQARAAR